MLWIPKRSDWPKQGITGFFGGRTRPVSAAIDPNLQDTDLIPIPVLITPQLSCEDYADGWELTVTISGVFGCPCTDLDEDPPRSQNSVISVDGAYSMIFMGPGHWQAIAAGSVSYNLYLGGDCDPDFLIENRVSTEVQVDLFCTGFPAQFTVRVTGISIDTGIAFINTFPLYANGQPVANESSCATPGNVGFSGFATLSAVHP